MTALSKSFKHYFCVFFVLVSYKTLYSQPITEKFQAKIVLENEVSRIIAQDDFSTYSYESLYNLNSLKQDLPFAYDNALAYYALSLISSDPSQKENNAFYINFKYLEASEKNIKETDNLIKSNSYWRLRQSNNKSTQILFDELAYTHNILLSLFEVTKLIDVAQGKFQLIEEVSSFSSKKKSIVRIFDIISELSFYAKEMEEGMKTFEKKIGEKRLSKIYLIIQDINRIKSVIDSSKLNPNLIDNDIEINLMSSRIKGIFKLKDLNNKLIEAVGAIGETIGFIYGEEKFAKSAKKMKIINH